jgi:hypothetical protein
MRSSGQQSEGTTCYLPSPNSRPTADWSSRSFSSRVRVPLHGGGTSRSAPTGRGRRSGACGVPRPHSALGRWSSSGTRRDTRVTSSELALTSVATKPETPWGRATIVEELQVPQRAGERRFATVVQLLVDEKGGELVRFAYTTDGTVRRGPVTLRGRDLERLRTALADRPRLAQALGLAAS